MHWLLQQNLSTEEQLVPFVKALDSLKSLDATWSFIKLVPFVGDVVPDDDYSGRKVFALGSTSMIVAAQKRNWSPGVIYDSKLFRYEAWLENLGAENLLNGDGIVQKFGDKIKEGSGEKFFVRPCEDLKAFTGEVINRENFISWQQRVRAGEVSTRALQLTSDTPIIISPPKFIYREWRFFVVDGEVITGSQYRDAYSKHELAEVPYDVFNFAQKMVDKWPMAPCFVIDIAQTKDDLKVIEINCFNGSGVYLCDMGKAFAAVEKYYNEN